MSAEILVTLSFFLIALGISSSFTSLAVQALKKVFGETWKKLPTNIVTSIVSLIIALGLSFGYAVLKDIGIDKYFIVWVIAYTGCTWLAAMLGYDKIKQTIEQKFKK